MVAEHYRQHKVRKIMSRELLKVIDEQNLRETPPEFEIGDTVDVHCMIHEGERLEHRSFQEL